MRVHQISCPKCGAELKSKAGILVGQTVPCPKCKTKFPVQAPDEADVIDDADVVEDFDDEEPAPKKKKGPPPPPPRKKRRVEEAETEEEEPLPRKKKRRPVDDTEEEEPVSRKKKQRRRRDDDEMGAYQKLKSNVLVRVITLVVLLGILAVVAYLYYEIKIKGQPEDPPPAKAPPEGQGDVE